MNARRGVRFLLGSVPIGIGPFLRQIGYGKRPKRDDRLYVCQRICAFHQRLLQS